MRLRLDFGTYETRRYLTLVMLAVFAAYGWGYRGNFFFDLNQVVVPFFNLTLGQVYSLILVLIILWILNKHI